MANTSEWQIEISERQPITGQRFEVLDSWRGICALFVVAFHFPLAGPISQNGIVRGAFLFVDFFFVLSGFVFAHAYGQRLMRGEGLAKFIVMRIGRLAPLHLFMLIVLVLLEIARWQIPALGNGRAIFTGHNALDALLANILMVHGLGVLDQLTWNTPSWSISTELFAYVFFGCLLVIAKKRVHIVIGLIFLASLSFLMRSPTFIDVTYDFGLVRCLYGFSAGFFVHSIFVHSIFLRAIFVRANFFSDTQKSTVAIWTCAELLMIASIATFVAYQCNTIYSLFAPLMFGLAVLVFARQQGHVSQLLSTKPFVYLGTISYSLYMTHLMVQASIYAFARFCHSQFGWADLSKLEVLGSREFVYSASENFYLVALMIGLTILVSSLTYRYVEKPSREWFRQMAGRFG